VEGWAVLLLAALPCGSALAQGREGVALSWERRPGAARCPDQTAFIAEVARRTSARLDESAPRRLAVLVDRRDGIWHAQLTLTDDERRTSTNELDATGADCTTIFKAAAVAAAIAIEHPEEEPTSTTAILHEDDPDSLRSSTIVRDPPFGDARPGQDAPRDTGARREPARRESAEPSNRFGLEIAQDLAFMSASDGLCRDWPTGSNAECYDGDRPVYNVSPDSPGRVTGGVGIATQRVLVSYDRAIAGPVNAMVRAGYAFGDTAPDNPASARFMPFHFELDVRYRLGGDPVRASLFTGAGIAEVNSHIDLEVVECRDSECDPRSPTSGEVRSVAAYRRQGQAFATAGAEVLWAFEGDVGAFFRMGGLFLFPAQGFVVQPSVGLAAGF
jgi:hypothetical protein